MTQNTKLKPESNHPWIGSIERLSRVRIFCGSRSRFREMPRAGAPCESRTRKRNNMQKDVSGKAFFSPFPIGFIVLKLLFRQSRLAPFLLWPPSRFITMHSMTSTLIVSDQGDTTESPPTHSTRAVPVSSDRFPIRGSCPDCREVSGSVVAGE